jgi:predicted HicB family RNase H-like nuclease
MDKKKLMNIKNPALNFIEEASEELESSPDLKIKMIDEIEPKRETLSRKLNILIKPSMYLSLSYIATKKTISINNLVNRILDDYIGKI